jgi:hypothetical protein
VLFEEERHYPHVVFEVDCFELVRIWKMGKDDRSIISPILDDIWEISFSFVSFSISLEAAQQIMWLTSVPRMLALMGCHNNGCRCALRF